jgi:hypothetical protein
MSEIHLSPEREIARQQWREKITNFITDHVVSPMIRPNLTNLEKGYSDDQIS